MQLDRADYDTLCEAIEKWEKGDDALERITDRLAVATVPDVLKPMFKQEIELRAAKAKEDANARKERGVLLRAKLLQIRDSESVT